MSSSNKKNRTINYRPLNSEKKIIKIYENSDSEDQEIIEEKIIEEKNLTPKKKKITKKKNENFDTHQSDEDIKIIKNGHQSDEDIKIIKNGHQSDDEDIKIIKNGNQSDEDIKINKKKVKRNISLNNEKEINNVQTEP